MEGDEVTTSVIVVVLTAYILCKISTNVKIWLTEVSVKVASKCFVLSSRRVSMSLTFLAYTWLTPPAVYPNPVFVAHRAYDEATGRVKKML